jgi:hypothetical protein
VPPALTPPALEVAPAPPISTLGVIDPEAADAPFQAMSICEPLAPPLLSSVCPFPELSSVGSASVSLYQANAPTPAGIEQRMVSAICDWLSADVNTITSCSVTSGPPPN